MGKKKAGARKNVRKRDEYAEVIPAKKKRGPPRDRAARRAPEPTDADREAELKRLRTFLKRRDVARSATDDWTVRFDDDGKFDAYVSAAGEAYTTKTAVLRALAPAASIPTQSELAAHYKFRGGISLAELRATAEAEARRIDPSIRTTQVDGHLATLPHALLDDLRRDSDDSVVLVNVLRYVADRWTGHWQPVGGYSELSDEEAFVLLLDPAAHKCVWHWVPLRLVVGCVCTTNSRGEARGYLRCTRAPS